MSAAKKVLTLGLPTEVATMTFVRGTRVQSISASKVRTFENVNVGWLTFA